MEKKLSAYQRIKARIKPENKIFVEYSFDIAEQVRYLLTTHPHIRTQKQLAEKLGKEESEVSRWLSGLHNLTLDSISKLSAAFGVRLIMTDLEARKRYVVEHIEKGDESSLIVSANNLATNKGANLAYESKNGERIKTDPADTKDSDNAMMMLLQLHVKVKESVSSQPATSPRPPMALA